MSSEDNTNMYIAYGAVFLIVTGVTYFLLYKKEPKFVMVNGAFYKEKAVFFALVAGLIVNLIMMVVMRMFRKAPMPLNMKRRAYYMA